MLSPCLLACSTSYNLGSFGQAADDKPAHTASAGTTRASGDERPMPPEADLSYARLAAAEVLTRGGKDVSQPWENPRSGARGTVTPLASSYRVDGALCRDFLASYVSEGQESWLQGEACRPSRGKWEVRRLKPWRQT